MSTTTTCVSSPKCTPGLLTGTQFNASPPTESNTTTHTTASTPETTAPTTGTSSTSPAIAFNPEQLKILRQYFHDNRERVGSWFKSTPSSPNPDTATSAIPSTAHPDMDQHSTLAQPKRPRKRPSWFEGLSKEATEAPHKDIRDWDQLGFPQYPLADYEGLTEHRCEDMARFGGLLTDAMNEIGVTTTFERFSSAVTKVGAAPRIPEKMAEAASYLLPQAYKHPGTADLTTILTKFFEEELKHPQEVPLTKEGLTLKESTKVVADGEKHCRLPDLETRNGRALSMFHLAHKLKGQFRMTWTEAIDAAYKGSNWDLLSQVTGANIEEEICRRLRAGETIPEGIPQSLKDAAEAKRANSSHIPTRTTSNGENTDRNTGRPSWTARFTRLPDPVSYGPASGSTKGAPSAMARLKRLLESEQQKGAGPVTTCANKMFSFL